MMLRVPPFSAILAASLAVAAVPAVAQSRGSNFADTTQQSSPYSGTVVEDIIAQVNDQVISKSDYQRAEQELEQEAQQQGWTQQQLYSQRKDLLRSLIDKQLLLSKGKELGINGETDVVKRLDEIRKQNHLDSMEDLQKAAEAQGVSFEDFKEQIRENVITSQVIGQEVGQHIQISPSEIREYYNAHQQEFQRPEQVQLSEILVTTPNPDDAAQVAEAKKKADGIEDRLKGGADFATVAKADSGGPTAAQGGELGEFKQGQLPKVMEDATFHLNAGQYTEPIRTKQGWLILEVTQHQNAGEAPLADVQNQIQEQVGYSKMEPALRAYLTQLRDQAYIEIAPGYADSGASPNEQKFVQAAYVPPGPKKKKKVTHARFREKVVRRQKQTETAQSGAPAGVPTLDQVNSKKGSSSKEVASNKGIQKPGKKEKIRYGQAPRETLPAGDTRMVDAGANGTTQLASNQPSGAVNLTTAAGNVIDTSNQPVKKTKIRFADREKEYKKRKAEAKAAKQNEKFTAPPETPEQLAAEKQSQSALGLNGDTTKAKKKANAAKSGPKRRYSDDKKEQQTEPDQQQNAAPAATSVPAPQTGSQPTPPSQP